MEIIAYLAAALIGISLGLMGGGGSILTVPVLVYLFGINPILATSYSLFIVGTTSLVGAYQNFRKKLVNIKIAFSFGVSSITTVFIIRQFFIPILPKYLFSIANFQVTSYIIIMVLFSLLMLLASFSMIKPKQIKESGSPAYSRNIGVLLLYGIGVGFTTGLLGAGGGFLLIPTLVILMGMPMKEAVGTSLLIIALNSVAGFMGDLGHFQFDWFFLFKITGIAMTGLFFGIYLSRQINGSKLKKGFGWFVLIMGGFILTKELLQ